MIFKRFRFCSKVANLKAEERLLKNLAKRATKQQLSKKGIVKMKRKL